MIEIWIVVFLLFITTLYSIVGWEFIKEKYTMFNDKNYWTNYNIIELIAWLAKSIIIIPGLIFGHEIWWMHFVTLITSSLLIWSAMKKSLPTLILFNTIWIGISSWIILKNLL